MLLAIDTSAGTSVAIVDTGRVLAQHSSDDPRGHAELIGSLISACLTESGVPVTSLTGVVAGIGPGPFTGLRVGIAAARAFAFGASIPVIPVVSHDAVAFGRGPVLVATDARRQEIYWSLYGAPDATGSPSRTRGPELAKATELDSIVAGFDGVELMQTRTVSAAPLALVAELNLAAGRPPEPDEALYLRSPDVTLSAGPKRVSG